MKQEQASELMAKARQAGQGHIFSYWEELSSESKEKLLRQLRAVDFDLMNELAEKYIFNPGEDKFKGELEPADILPVPKTEEQLQRAAEAKKAGEQLLRAGKVAAVLVAGGQGTRLGYEGPKGEFPIGPISKKSLFQLHAEKIKAMALKYGNAIPWFIMTSETNDQETRRFFADNNYFGLDPADVSFFVQGMIPALNEQGKLILDAKDHIFTNPNGHGGTLFALRDSGAILEMKKRGIEEIFYFQVDNVLIKICDPYFLGYHHLKNAEMSAKVVPKRDAYEKVGIIGKLNGKVTVIEYSDFPESEMVATQPDGTLKYNSGSIAIHVFKLAFIERITSGELNLPYHKAYKKIPYLDENGKLIKPETPNGYKFEMFVFDALPLAKNSVIMEVERKEEFSPVKNKTGENSPDMARRDLVNYYGRMLQRAGVEVPFDDNNNVRGTIEISPLFALTEEDLKQKLNANFKFKDGLYLE